MLGPELEHQTAWGYAMRHVFLQIVAGGQIFWVLDDEEQEPLLSASGCRG